MYTAQGEMLCGSAANAPATAVRGMYGDLPITSYAPVAASLVQQYEQSAPAGMCPAVTAADKAKPLREGFFPTRLPMMPGF